ncbi:MAG: alpha-L-rhamnosidase N-terminal domain-containing protein [bacterium]
MFYFRFFLTFEFDIFFRNIGEEVLATGGTDYKKRVLYVIRDIGQYLRKGENVVGVMLGNGRYSTPDEVIEKTPNSLVKFGEHPVLIVQVKIKFSDGTEKIICSDDSWKVNSGPVQFNDIYDGERYNACLEKEGWDRPGFDDPDWVKAVRADPAPEVRLVSHAVYSDIQ